MTRSIVPTSDLVVLFADRLAPNDLSSRNAIHLRSLHQKRVCLLLITVARSSPAFMAHLENGQGQTCDDKGLENPDSKDCAPEVYINDVLTNDSLREILTKLPNQSEKDTFGLVCKRWLVLQSNERQRLGARSGPLMLQRIAARFTHLLDLDFGQSASRSFYPGVGDSDLFVTAKSFKILERLNLQYCYGISDTGLHALGAGLPHLLWVDLSECKQISDKGVEALAQGCPHLQAVCLSGCKLITDKALEALSRSCKNLANLNLQGCVNVGDVGLLSLSRGCKCVQVLDLSKCAKIGTPGVQSIAEAFSGLMALKLCSCLKVNDDALKILAENCRHLELLMLDGCQMLSNEGFKALAFGCGQSLKILGLKCLRNLSDEAIQSIFLHCTLLEELNLDSCPRFTDDGFSGLRECAAALKVLSLNCSGITNASIVHIAESCRQLEILEVKYCSGVAGEGVEILPFPKGCKVIFENYVTSF